MMKEYFSFSLTVIISQLIICCSDVDEQIEVIFELSGENCKNIEKVLNNYSNEPKKQKAAHHLIINMLGHSGVTSSNIGYHLII